ncbi:MAG: MFS transporter [Actinomycetes bacterium]
MSRANARIALAALAVLLTAADTYVVVLALPDMMRAVGLNGDELGRAAPIISIFLLGYVAMLPTVGRLADLVGRVPVLTGCLVVFAAGCLVTTTAHTLPSVVVGRGLQGIGAGGLVPATLALVADAYPPGRRGVPLGAVGAAQEAGALLGPLYGALILSVAAWRAIFWVNLAAGAVLAIAMGFRRARVDWLGVGLAMVAVAGLVLLLVAPAAIVNDYTYGTVYDPLFGGGRATSPLAVGTLVLAVLAAVRLVHWRRLAAVARRVDVPGALLAALTLGCVVLALSVGDPQKHAIAVDGPYLLAAAGVFLLLFVVRERRAADPLVPPRAFARRPAYGGLIVSLFIGAALIAALVDVPIIGRLSGRNQLGAALLLVRLLAAVPVGALLGGRASHAIGPRLTVVIGALLAATGIGLMTQWHRSTLAHVDATVALVVAGFGFGLTIAPINAAVLDATSSAVHGLASAMVIVARTVGMLVGLSALTAIGLSRFAHATARLASPLELCPQTPAHCTPYNHAVRDAGIAEVHAVFTGASIAAGLAALCAAVLLSGRLGAPSTAADAAAPR